MIKEPIKCNKTNKEAFIYYDEIRVWISQTWIRKLKMIKCFNVYIYTYHNGTFIREITHKVHSRINLDLDAPKDYEVKLTWDNLDDFYQMHGLECGFNIWELKKGRMVSFFLDGFPFKNFKDFKDVKEWKTPDLNITMKYMYKEYTPRISEVLEWYNTELALQWLKENGITNCGIGLKND